MPGGRLAILGIIVLVVLIVVILGSAVMALSDSLRHARGEQAKRNQDQASKPRPEPPPRTDPRRYTPRRIRLRWNSPEIIAILLLALAAGLWIARLAG